MITHAHCTDNVSRAYQARTAAQAARLAAKALLHYGNVPGSCQFSRADTNGRHDSVSTPLFSGFPDYLVMIQHVIIHILIARIEGRL